MFEKEAEKWVENNLHSTEEDYIKAFNDGADFGYNKAKEELEKENAGLKAQIEQMKSDVELARDNANKTEDWETFSVLNSILDD